jgi:murein DD-endopeptidase MepM/ murein hydrolase activator NlpD
MPSLPAALALLVSGAALTGVAVAAPGAEPGERRLLHGTVATPAGPRRVVTVLPSGSLAGMPPGPAGDLVSTRSEAGAGRDRSPGVATPAPAGIGASTSIGSSTATGTPTNTRSPTVTGTPASGGFDWPVAGTPSVLRAFTPGPHPWSPGHRGVDVAGTGPVVLAAGPGTVTFAGSIAGRGVVVIEHGSGLRTTYEPVSAQVVVGRVLRRGDPVGSLQAAGLHCTPVPCLHWGARIGDRYLDPISLIARPRRPPVLLPLLTTPR